MSRSELVKRSGVYSGANSQMALGERAVTGSGHFRGEITVVWCRPRESVGNSPNIGSPLTDWALVRRALAPDADETSQSQQNKFPKTDVFAHIEVTDGRVWFKPSGVPCFAGDLPEAEQKLVYATQGVPVADLFDQKHEGVAWKTKPSW